MANGKSDIKWVSITFESQCIKGALSGLRYFLAIENLLKMIKNAFYFTLNSLFVLKFCLDFSDMLDYKDLVNFKINDITTWKTNNCNGHITQYLKK